MTLLLKFVSLGINLFKFYFKVKSFFLDCERLILDFLFVFRKFTKQKVSFLSMRSLKNRVSKMLKNFPTYIMKFLNQNVIITCKPKNR
ncbi:MAG: hypothetical protein DRQ49_00040 [Gammaproteobacteria bacterium]|nr:MAG: hypothetical protein DRQ49_00040 [Gammaproteobacteria bacterium]RKZ43868.1 MAG: hypothetical protein DRQ41_04195 [Gammaproteobacteria bacterium]RKZ77133.1 MAG: hypothetical protein DRQ57_01400 [Gammaproteobacteria bacterium]